MSAKTVEINISKYISDGWKILKKNWKLLLQTGFVLLVVQSLPNISEAILGRDNQTGILLLLPLLTTVLSFIVSLGWLNILIKLAAGKKAVFADLWGSIDRVIPYFIASLAVGLLVIFGLIFFIIPGLYFSLKYMFVLYLIVDKKIGVSEAFKVSAKMTEGIKWQLAVMWLAVLVLNILGVLALFVGVIVTSMITSLAYSKLYHDIYKKRIG